MREPAAGGALATPPILTKPLWNQRLVTKRRKVTGAISLRAHYCHISCPQSRASTDRPEL